MNYIHLPTRVRDCKIPNDANWTLIDIEQKIFSSNTYKMYIYVDNTNTVFLKPYTPYMSKEFEDLFGFGIMCQDYDENKVVQVIAPNKYYTNFQ